MSANDSVNTVSTNSIETIASMRIDKKKQRCNKRKNKKRKKACHNWAKKS